MPDAVFCYSCRNYHPKEEMVVVVSKNVQRWRCLKSIAESRISRDQREVLGNTPSYLEGLR